MSEEKGYYDLDIKMTCGLVPSGCPNLSFEKVPDSTDGQAFMTLEEILKEYGNMLSDKELEEFKKRVATNKLLKENKKDENSK